MKHCPACGRAYADDTQVYCLTDGTILARTNAPVSNPNLESQATLVYQQQPTNNPPYNAPPSTWPPNNAAAPQWPNAAPAASPRKASPLPWIIGGGLLLAVGIAVGLMFYLSSSEPAPSGPVADTSNTPRSTPTASPVSQQSPSPSSSPEPASTVAPTDTDEILTQLTDIENEWNDANTKGDSVAIKRILADEFRGVGGNGTVENKDQYLASLAPTPIIKSLTLSDLKVSATNGTAVLTGLNTAKFKKGGPQVYRFTDTFIWRDGRWQAISSQATRVK